MTMTAIQLKQFIKKEVDAIDDEPMLENIIKVIHDLRGEVRTFTPEQRERVLHGLEQMRNGEVVSEEEADREIEEWLGKK